MKKLYVIFAVLFLLMSLNATVFAQENNSDKLLIVCTTADQQVYDKMVFPYASFALKQGWFEKVEILFWGPGDKTIAENPDSPETLKMLADSGVKLTACKWCAEQYEVADKLAELGIEVKYMGQPLTDMLKSDCKVLSF